MCFAVPILSTPYIESSVSVITSNSSTWHNFWPVWHNGQKWFSFPHLWHTWPYAGHLPFPWWPPQYWHWFCLAPFCFEYCSYCLGLCFLCFWVLLGLVFALFFTALTVSFASSAIFLSCSCVASLILSISTALFKPRSFSLNSLALATLSLHPSTNLSRIISSCNVLNWDAYAKRCSRIRYLSTVSFGCCWALWNIYRLYSMFLPG